MSKHEDEKNQRTQRRKRPYETPRVEESGRFERLVLACGTAEGSCPLPFQS